MQVDIVNTSNDKVGTIDLPDEVFGAEVNEALLWEQVKAQRASRRAGTHKTKHRGEVSGGGAKPYRQKGTGRARQGSSRAPNHVGGGTVFGPRPRDYSYRLPRTARRAALCSALSLRAKEGLVVLDQCELAAPKTQQVAQWLRNLGAENALVVDADNINLKLSARNLAKAKYVPALAVNVYDILKHEKLVLTKAALEAVVQKATASVAESAA
jgi:large subunit ribosomal protein L4